MRRETLYAILATGLLVGLAASAIAQDRGSVDARLIRDFARISFTFDSPAYISAKAQGDVVTVKLEQPISSVQLNQAMRSLGSIVTHHQLDQSGKRLRLKLSAAHSVRSFTSGQRSGIDVLGVTPPVAFIQPQPPAILGQPAQTQPRIASVVRAADEVAAPVEAVRSQGPQPAPSAESALPPSDEEIPKEVTAILPEEDEESLVQPTLEAAPKETLDQVTGEIQLVKKPASFKVEADLVGDVLTLKFPFKERTAAAAFIRGDVAWIVFNRATKLDLSRPNHLLNPVTPIRQIDFPPGVTLLKLPVKPNTMVLAQPQKANLGWTMDIQPTQLYVNKTPPIQLRADPPLKPHVFLPVLDLAEPIALIDERIGDTLLVVPSYAAATKMQTNRYFVDFDLLKTDLGLVVLKRAQDTSITFVRNGVRFSTDRGAFISSNLPPIEKTKKKTATRKESVTHFPFDAWKHDDSHLLNQEIRALIRNTIGAEETAILTIYQRIAEMLLAQGRSAEAIGYLDNIKRKNAEYYTFNKLAAMHGVAHFLMHRYPEAARVLAAPELAQDPEMLYFKSMLGELLGEPDQQLDYTAHYDTYGQFYPPVFKQRLGILAADRAIASQQYNQALKIFDQLGEQELLSEVGDYINYLMGQIAVKTGQEQDGFRIWNELLASEASQFVKMRTQFAIISEQYKQGIIDADMAAKQLERIAVRWRGDSLEITVLTALGNIYREQKDWPNAIAVWQALNASFSGTIDGVNAARSIRDAFVGMFARGETGGLSAMDLFFLYQKYKGIAPLGKTGDKIIESVGDIMIELDLLPEAAAMLEQQMRYKFEHQTRSIAGTQLAKIYLMDYKPGKAIEALQQSMFGRLPDGLLTKRRYLAAEALLELKRYEELFTLLKGDESAHAHAFRLEAHWRRKQWEELAAQGEALLKLRRSPMADITDIESDAILKLAVAYRFMRDEVQLSYLRDYFLPLLKEDKNHRTIEFATRPDMYLNPDSFSEVAASLEGIQSYLKAGL